MELRRDGQIYEFLCRWEMRKPTNLCSLFWKLVGSFLFAVFVGSALGTLAVSILFFFGALIHSFFTGVFVSTPIVDVGGVLFLALIFMSLLLWIFSWLDDRPQRPPGLVSEAFLGLKDKYCPTITWK